jgi:hypothetical protein
LRWLCLHLAGHLLSTPVWRNRNIAGQRSHNALMIVAGDYLEKSAAEDVELDISSADVIDHIDALGGTL